MSSVEPRSPSIASSHSAPLSVTLTRTLAATPTVPKPKSRIRAIDLARGVAVVLMILSHGVSGIVAFDDFPSWGLVPIHMVTKFASTLFILVFGISLAVSYLPYVDTPQWPHRRRKLLVRGLIVLFWYKVLTVVELAYLNGPVAILGALLYVNFPSYVEILGFYAIALLWVPFVLPVWKRMSLAARLASPLAIAVASTLLLRHFDFWGIAQLQALLVEHEDYYTWGQLARAPLVLLGLLLGELVLRHYARFEGRLALAGGLLVCSSALWIVFVVLAAPDFHGEMLQIALNMGKHPPELLFMVFSMAGALFILALALLGAERLAGHRLVGPVMTIGSDALKAFVFHIVVIFFFFRYLFGLFHSVSYELALTLTILLIFATAVWIRLTNWVLART